MKGMSEPHKHDSNGLLCFMVINMYFHSESVLLHWRHVFKLTLALWTADVISL